MPDTVTPISAIQAFLEAASLPAARAAIGGATDITHSALLSARNGSALVPGQWYRITDYATKYARPRWAGIGTTWDVEWAEAAVEQIWVQAIAVNKVSMMALAPDFPQDVLVYDLDDVSFTTTRSTGQTAGTQARKGFIQRRTDTKRNISLPYDYRAMKWNRYKADLTNFPLYNAGTNYAAFSLFRCNSAGADSGNRNLYMTVAGGTGALTSAHFLVADIVGTYWVGRGAQNIAPAFTNNAEAVLRASGTAVEFFTFSSSLTAAPSETSSTVVDVLQQGLAAAVYNNVIFATSSCYENTLGSGFVGNTIGSGFSRNSISSGFTNNTIGSGFYRNVVGSAFSGNTLSNDYYDNRISSDFSNNTTGFGFVRNTVGGGCYGNTLGADFENNVVGTVCHNNVIGNGAVNNKIGSGCSGNGIGSGFSGNTFGENFFENTLGNDFVHSVIGDAATANVFGGGATNNICGDRFAHNTTGTSFAGNSIAHDFNNNTIGNNCTYNVIGDNFGNNIIDIDFSQNSVRHPFYNNTIAGNLANTQFLATVNGVNLSSAAVIYYPYSKTVIMAAGPVLKLAYHNGTGMVYGPITD